MRIIDLLKKESIDLNGIVTTKKETIEKMTLLMEKGGNVKDLTKYRAGYLKEKRKERPESEKELQFHMRRRMR